ncbi:MAG TPA: AarF/UbiB family protein [Thermoanaerobaculia bacterium]|nr:AarF/UbiB family protein [Thermoanaerobaculia bacterium]
MKTAWLNARRLGQILRVLAAHALANLLGARLERWPWLARRLPPGVLPEPDRLRMIFEDLGGTFLKLGQMLALQPDILPFAYCNALFNLMDRVAPFPYESVERIVQEELGARPGELFDGFDRRPLATASIGQVHAATLGGRALAVKVQRPSVEVEFHGDIRLMVMGIRLIRGLRIRKLEWLLEPMTEFISWTREELDYRYEARYMERLRANARRNDRERIPALLPERSGRRVLTVEFLAGTTVLDYLRALDVGDEVTLARVRATGFEPDAFARNIIDNFLGDAFQHGMFHADLHPANLMILPDNVVGYIDFGITAVLSTYSRRNLVALTFAYTRGDLDGMCEAFFKVSVLHAGSDPKAFRDGLSKLALGWYERDGDQVRLKKNFTLMMLDMLTLSRATGILPERDVVKYIRSAIAIDGLITRFAPEFDVGLYLEWVCDRLIRMEAQRSLFTFDRLAGWSAAGFNLASDGPVRSVELLRRLASGNLPVEGDVVLPRRRSGRREAAGQKAVQLGALLLALAVSIALAGGGLRLGVNLFTAQMLLFTATLGVLLRTVGRPT